ncbi:MAG: 2Fe-2S iron-sulfur cluster-binding protein [Candidatus Gracilibacteria bacterium]|jgi:ferredoxin
MPKITFKNTNQTIETAPNKPLKEITKEQGWSIPYGCEDGVCGTCLLRVAANPQGLSSAEEKEIQTLDAMGLNDGNHRLGCQCKIVGDTTIEI